MAENRAGSYRFSYKSLFAFLPIVYYVINVYRMRGGSARIYLVVLAALGLLGAVTLIRNRGKRLTLLLLFAALYMASLIPNWILIKNVDTASLFSNLCLLGMTAVIMEYPWSRRQGWFGFYAVLAMVVVAFFTRSQTRIFGSSNNYVSVVMLLAAPLYYLPLEGREGRIRWWDVAPAALIFMVCVWATGRGGILCSLVFLVLVLLLYMRSLTGKNAQRIVLLFIVLLIGATVLLLRNVSLLDRFMNLGKFRTRGATSASRIKVWSAYFSKTASSPLYILLGAPLKDIRIIHNLGDNCHNSFLQLHAFGGLLIFIVYMVLLVQAVVFYSSRKQWITFAVLITLMLRGMTDKFVFGQYGMPLMLYLTLMPLIRRRITARQYAANTMYLLDRYLRPGIKKKKRRNPHGSH